MKTVKTVILAILVMAMLFGTGAQVAAADEQAKVCVTISDGTLRLAREQVTLADADGDGALTLNDALYLAHEAKYEGGAAAGYGSAASDYGVSITKLWGVESGSGYGYYINNASAMSLMDTVKDGDCVSAFVYTDTVGFSDTYCYFDKTTLSADSGEVFTLTLNAAAFDENWNPVVKPVEGASITVDGVKTEYKTDAEGRVSIMLDGEKACIISAVSETQTLVPPVCEVNVSQPLPDTGVSSPLLGASAFAAALFVMILTASKRRNAYEK